MTAVQTFGKKALATFMALVVACAVAMVPALTVNTSEAQAASISSVAKKGGSGSAATKLKKIATYEKKFAYASLYSITKKTHLTKMSNKGITKYAKWMAKNGKGSCYHYAALFAKAAKKATGCKVRVGVGASSLSKYHAWAEVKVSGKWRIYDPLMSKSKGGHIGVKRGSVKADYNYFSGAKYTTVK